MFGRRCYENKGVWLWLFWFIGLTVGAVLLGMELRRIWGKQTATYHVCK